MLSGDSTKHTWQLKTILLSESGKFGSIFGKPKFHLKPTKILVAWQKSLWI